MDDTYGLRARVDRSAPVTTTCDGRGAWVVRKLTHVGHPEDGVVEFLAYEKYGRLNFAMRWRPLREDEVVEPKALASNGTSLGGAELGSAIEALRARFGNGKK